MALTYEVTEEVIVKFERLDDETDNENKTREDNTQLEVHVDTSVEYQVHIKEEPKEDSISLEGEKKSEVIKKKPKRIRPKDTRIFQCNKCFKYFSSPSSFSRHKHVHAGDQSYPCPVCGQLYSETSSLKRHLRLKHDLHEKSLGGYSCDMCERIFYTKNLLAKHLFKHKYKKMVCDVCLKEFTSKRNLIDHLLGHEGVKPYHCDICKTKFSRRKCYNEHMQYHTGENMFTCNYCKKMFVRQSYLTVHERSHTGDKPFLCNVCDRRFNAKSSLVRHTRKQHPGEITIGKITLIT